MFVYKVQRMEGEFMRLRAMAKINLGLDVLRKREDGYHEVRMIMQTIQMYDLLDIRKKEEPGISLSTNLPYVPSDERNLVYKAAKLLMDEFDIKEGLSMKLTKFIPVAAGMAGGSSDAAAAFVGVNRLFRLGLSEEELMKRAVQVGADVPYCVMRGTALAEGIGEKLTRLPGLPKCYVLVGKPGINVSTKLAYENLHLDQIQSHPDIDGMISDIENQDLHSLTAKMQNVFEPGIITTRPSSSSFRIASLTGVLLTPRRSASAISISRSPGFSSPFKIALRSVLNTTSRNGRYSFMSTEKSFIISTSPFLLFIVYLCCKYSFRQMTVAKRFRSFPKFTAVIKYSKDGRSASAHHCLKRTIRFHKIFNLLNNRILTDDSPKRCTGCQYHRERSE